MSLGWATICSIVLYILLFPFYVYGLVKWYQWRDHPFFRLRYSYPEGLILIVLSLTSVHVNLVHFTMYDLGYVSEFLYYHIYTAMFSIYYIVVGLVYYRTNLTFLTYKQYQVKLYEMGITMNSQQQQFTSFNAISPRRHCSSQTLISVTSVGGCVILFFYYTPKLVGLVFWMWCFHVLVGIAVFIVVKVKRVRELLGCLYELYLICALIVILWVLVIFAPKQQQLIQFATIASDHAFSMLTLYFLLYAIFKSEKTLSIPYASETASSPKSQLSALQLTHEMSECKVIKQIDVDADDKSLHKFLESRKEYELFSKYLALVWCLENLMFIERVCVFRWLVLQKMEGSDTAIEALQIDSGNNRKYYGLKFLFLDNVYGEYGVMVKDKSKNDFASNQHILWSFCHDIYTEFICNEAANQINIPYGVRIGLEKKLKSEENIDEHFLCYDDFLGLFNSAMDNAWSLLQTAYTFKFAMFLDSDNEM